ncbi:response regulator [Azospirillum sp. ST 5-10]|uniref:response regulator n=1 Tax=unclassified Azospirillum TaxID=2630922 RepID=UPI003F4A04F9
MNGPNDVASRDIVLVVDDAPDSLSLLTDALEEAGLTVLVALDGPAALELLERITPDIVLLDAVMPGMDGFETCRRLKGRGGLADLPVIFMTGLSETEHVVRGFEAGGTDYVTKPIIPRELIARTRVHLANARMARSARVALDATGRFLFAADTAGRVRWCTPQAAQLLAEILGAPDAALPPEVGGWLAASAAHGPADGPLLAGAGGRGVRVAYVGRIGPDEHLLRLAEAAAGGPEGLLKERLALTAREAEVLLWLARGKPNRDIAEILGLSPRTVNKHLEQIFAKLGVENRTAAATLAIRTMGEAA